MTEYTRHKIRPECGTRAGYDFHRRSLKEVPCNSCTEAEREYHRERRVRDKYRISVLRKANRLKNPNLTIHCQFTMAEIFAEYGDNCNICGEQIDATAPRKVGVEGWEKAYHPDHLIPLSKGGKDTLNNVRPVHAQCNIRKWATI